MIFKTEEAKKQERNSTAGEAKNRNSATAFWLPARVAPKGRGREVGGGVGGGVCTVSRQAGRQHIIYRRVS